MLQGVNMPLGFPEQDPIRQIAMPFDSGDMFFFYSDGLTEARNPDGEFYGEERLVDLISAEAQIGAEKLINVVYENREKIKGLKMVYEPKYLRFFQARFEKL